MMRLSAILAAIALTACATQLPQVVVTGGDTFDVRYDSRVQTTMEADRRADQQCGAAAAFENERVGFDDLSYRTYRCRER